MCSSFWSEANCFLWPAQYLYQILRIATYRDSACSHIFNSVVMMKSSQTSLTFGCKLALTFYCIPFLLLCTDLVHDCLGIYKLFPRFPVFLTKYSCGGTFESMASHSIKLARPPCIFCMTLTSWHVWWSSLAESCCFFLFVCVCVCVVSFIGNRCRLVCCRFLTSVKCGLF